MPRTYVPFMGGDRETMAPQRVAEKGETRVVGSIRYHESNGEIHFHDDANGLKVVVPGATWLAAFQAMVSSLPASRQFVDPERKAVLCVEMRVKKRKTSPRLVTCLFVRPIEIDKEFLDLSKFTYG